MGVTAVFVDESPNGRRITVAAEEEACLDAVAGSLRAVGFRLELIDGGVDTAWDLAATCPDLLILAVSSDAAAGRLPVRLSELRGHPRLRATPLVLCAPADLQPLSIAAPQSAAFRIVDARDEEELTRLVVGLARI